MSKLSFDANKVKPQVALDPFPAGWYNAHVTKTDLKPTPGKAGKAAGKRLEIEFTILDGDYKGRKVFDGFNLENANPVAAQIGNEQLSAVCHATGVFKVTDTAQLHGKPLQLKVGYEGEHDGYDARNNYKGCKPLDGAANGGPTTPVTGGPAPAWAGKKDAPAETPAEEPTKKTPPGKKVAAAVAEVLKKWGLLDEANAAGEFWVLVTEGQDPSDLKVPDILEMLGKGMPLETPVMLQGSDDEWKAASDYFGEIEEAAPAVEEKKAPPAKAAARNAVPWTKK